MPPKSKKGGNKRKEKEPAAETGAAEKKAPAKKGKKAAKKAEEPAAEEPKVAKKKIDESDDDEQGEAKDGFWEEPICAGLFLKAKMKDKPMANFKSPFQDVKVFETETFGKQLVLDGYTQSSQRDEFIYHESLVHPAMFAHKNPEYVFIGGGGEMATAREVLRHKSVKKLIMCDLDEAVCKKCAEFLPEWGAQGCFDDPRFEIVYDDAKKYLEESKIKFDVVIMDISDPIACGPGILLYTTDFYEKLKSKLNPGFVFVTQSGPCGLWTHEECFSTINSTLRKAFDVVHPYNAFVPSFCDCWGFNLAYDKEKSLKNDLPEQAGAELDDKIAKRLKAGSELKFYDGTTHKNMFNVPKYIRVGCKKETRVMTAKDPVFMDAEYRPIGFTDSHGRKVK